MASYDWNDPEGFRSLAVSVAWVAQQRDIPVSRGAAFVAHSMHTPTPQNPRGVFHEVPIGILEQAAFLGQAFRQLGLDILASHPEATIGELQEMVGLDAEVTRIPFIFKIETIDGQGNRRTGYRTITVEVDPKSTVESAMQQAQNMIALVMEEKSPGFAGRFVEIVHTGPVA